MTEYKKHIDAAVRSATEAEEWLNESGEPGASLARVWQQQSELWLCLAQEARLAARAEKQDRSGKSAGFGT
jgi:hypothetical protein